MQRTANFRRQHDDILSIATEISNLLNAQALSKDASNIAILNAKLAGKVKFHLAMEDDSLYPRLLKENDDKVKSLAQKYISEMGGISKTYLAYLDKWKNAAAIQANAMQYVNETKNLFKVLADRISKENNELYPIIDNAA